MGVLRNSLPGMQGKNGEKRRGGGITVKCPKCQANIAIPGLNGREPVRCAKCHYPMILTEDMKAIVNACRELKNSNQVDCAVGILCKMVEYMPQAGTAIGALANKYPLPISENEKWAILNSAYAGGDGNAQEWLNLMCQTSPDRYQRCICKHCGAIKYIDRQDRIRNVCVFCRKAD